MVDGCKNLIDPLVLDVDVSQDTGTYPVNRITYFFFANSMSYLLTDWPAYLYGRIQSPGPDVMGIMRAAGFEFARIDT